MASAIPRPFLQAMAASAPPPSQEMLSRINSARLAALVENLSSHFNTAARSPDDLLKMCFSLARGIDFALSNNDIPAIAGRLPSLLKQVYQHKNDNSMKPAITMLMISVKNACRNGWFHVTDSAELLKMADELCNSFCMATSIVTTEMRNALDTISNIFPRFYPQLKLCHLVVSFEAKWLHHMPAEERRLERRA